MGDAFSAAQQLWSAGEIHACAQSLESANDPQSLLLRARALLRLNRPQEVVQMRAVDALLKRCAAAPYRAEAHMLLSQSYLRLDMRQPAAMHLKIARTAAHPSQYDEIAYYEAYALWVERRLDEAEATLPTTA